MDFESEASDFVAEAPLSLTTDEEEQEDAFNQETFEDALEGDWEATHNRLLDLTLEGEPRSASAAAHQEQIPPAVEPVWAGQLLVAFRALMSAVAVTSKASNLVARGRAAAAEQAAYETAKQQGTTAATTATAPTAAMPVLSEDSVHVPPFVLHASALLLPTAPPQAAPADAVAAASAAADTPDAAVATPVVSASRSDGEQAKYAAMLARLVRGRVDPLAAAAAEGALVLPPCVATVPPAALDAATVRDSVVGCVLRLCGCVPRVLTACGVEQVVTEGSLAAWHGSSDGDGAVSTAGAAEVKQAFAFYNAAVELRHV